MHVNPQDVARVRLDNALLLFEEFVRVTARHADAAALRGLERRFAERLQIQPSYWSQIKSRSRQIGERLARQFEELMHKPRGWMDVAHRGAAEAVAAKPDGGPAVSANAGGGSGPGADGESLPRDDDERFIVGLVLTYYRRHPARARTRLLDLLGEVLLPSSGSESLAAMGKAAAEGPPEPPQTQRAGASDDAGLWRRSQAGVAPLKRRT